MFGLAVLICNIFIVPEENSRTLTHEQLIRCDAVGMETKLSFARKRAGEVIHLVFLYKLS